MQAIYSKFKYFLLFSILLGFSLGMSSCAINKDCGCKEYEKHKPVKVKRR